MAKTKIVAVAETDTANDNSKKSKRTARFALYDQHLARARIFLLHGRGKSAASKYSHLDGLSDIEIARRTRARDPKERIVLPPVTMDVVEPRHDPALCAPGGKLTLVVTSVYPVGVPEETLLLVLLSLAAKKRHDEDRKAGVILTTSASRDLAVKAIEARGDGPLKETIMAIHVSRRRLLNELGYTGGAGYEYLKARLRRLRWIGYDATLIEGNVERAWGGSQLLSYDLIENDPDALIKINLNERFARVLLGANGTRKRAPYDRIDLDERFALKSEAAKLLHMRVSVDIRAEKDRKNAKAPRSKTYKIAELIEDLYAPDSDALKPETIRKRRHDIKAAFAEVGALPGWSVEIGKDTVAVSRKGDAPVRKRTAKKADVAS